MEKNLVSRVLCAKSIDSENSKSFHLILIQRELKVFNNKVEIEKLVEQMLDQTIDPEGQQYGTKM